MEVWSLKHKSQNKDLSNFKKLLFDRVESDPRDKQEIIASLDMSL